MLFSGMECISIEEFIQFLICAKLPIPLADKKEYGKIYIPQKGMLSILPAYIPGRR